MIQDTRPFALFIESLHLEEKYLVPVLIRKEINKSIFPEVYIKDLTVGMDGFKSYYFATDNDGIYRIYPDKMEYYFEDCKNKVVRLLLLNKLFFPPSWSLKYGKKYNFGNLRSTGRVIEIVGICYK
jgi:hypothetical protein